MGPFGSWADWADGDRFWSGSNATQSSDCKEKALASCIRTAESFFRMSHSMIFIVYHSFLLPIFKNFQNICKVVAPLPFLNVVRPKTFQRSGMFSQCLQ